MGITKYILITKRKFKRGFLFPQEFIKIFKTKLHSHTSLRYTQGFLLNHQQTATITKLFHATFTDSFLSQPRLIQQRTLPQGRDLSSSMREQYSLPVLAFVETSELETSCEGYL